MVNKSRPQRVSTEFEKYVKDLQNSLSPILGRKPSTREVTGSISNFLRDEGTRERMLRRAKVIKKRRERWLF